MRDERAASLRPVNIVRWARAAEVSGVEEESAGMCAKGIRKARKLQGREGRALGSVFAEVLQTYSWGTDHVRGVKNAGIFPRRKPHVAHNKRPTRTPKPRFATTPHACQSQYPAHVLMEARVRGEAVAEGATMETVDEADENDIEADELEDEPKDVIPLIALDSVENKDERDRELEAVLEEVESVGVAVINADRVVLTLVSVVQIATPSPFVVVVIVDSTVMPNSL